MAWRQLVAELGWEPQPVRRLELERSRQPVVIVLLPVRGVRLVGRFAVFCETVAVDPVRGVSSVA